MDDQHRTEGVASILQSCIWTRNVFTTLGEQPGKGAFLPAKIASDVLGSVVAHEAIEEGMREPLSESAETLDW